MSEVWVGAAFDATIVALVAFACWLAGGGAFGLLALALGLILVWVRQLRRLAALGRWLDQPQEAPVPDASGAWGAVFSKLGRRAKDALQARAELSLALERFMDAAHAMPDGVIVLQRNETIEWINRTAESHFGLDRGSDRGRPITNLVRQPDFVGYLREGEFGVPLVLDSARIPGQCLSLQVVPFGADRKLIISRDITQPQKLEAMRRDFVANVSHELRTPLTVIGGFLETLADDPEGLEPQQAARFVRLALEQARHMQTLVHDLLTLARLESAAPPPLDEAVEVTALMAEVAVEARALSGGRHRIEVDFGEPTRLLGSRAELRSAFANLASNAVRYTPEGGRIELRWELRENGCGVYRVEDDGIGIESRHLARLTERFYRVDRGRSRETGGTGLGLAIVKHVLTRHQASLEIDSRPGAGSRFSARFAPSRVLPGSVARDAAAQS